MCFLDGIMRAGNSLGKHGVFYIGLTLRLITHAVDYSNTVPELLFNRTLHRPIPIDLLVTA
jgi:hypothetical protein